MNTFTSIFWDSMRPMKLITVPLYLVAGLGVWMRSRDASGDVSLIFHVAPVYVWVPLFVAIATARVVGLWWWSGNALTRRTTPIVGIALWSFLFTSSVVAANTGLGSLYLVAATLEVWFLARAFTERTPAT